MVKQTEAEIYVRTSFQAFHRWKDAPPEVDFLASFHRHLFVVEATLPVTHANRQLEFFKVKAQIDSLCFQSFEAVKMEYSCEAIAYQIASFCLTTFSVPWARVDISEDGENGARVTLKEVDPC